MGGYDEIIDSLQVSPQLVIRTAERFSSALANPADRCGLKLLDSHFSRPTGHEQGEALALDFGGSNLRVLWVRVADQALQTLQTRVISLRHNRWGQDLTTAFADSYQLFDYIAAEIGEFADKQRNISLGHCFSFPFRPMERTSGVLLEWTKEIKTGGVVGEDINRLLSDALQRQGLENIKPQALLNDTVGTLLCAAYHDKHADVGSICGTGHNSCFVDQSDKIINIEAGNFHADILPVNSYDLQLDCHSTKPGQQRLEKMVAGAYLGELFRLMLLDLAGRDKHLPSLELLVGPLAIPGAIDSRQVSSLLSAGSFHIADRPCHLSRSELPFWQRLATALVNRSARLIAATYLGIISHLDPSGERQHLVSIDGSMYEKMPGFADGIRTGLNETGLADRIETKFWKDSSGLGAALAAIMAARG